MKMMQHSKMMMMITMNVINFDIFDSLGNYFVYQNECYMFFLIVNCGRKSLNDDAYYCNKELMQLLIFDAKVYIFCNSIIIV